MIMIIITTSIVITTMTMMIMINMMLMRMMINYPGAFLKPRGIRYTTIAGSAVR
jgi:hypothetical protein